MKTKENGQFPATTKTISSYAVLYQASKYFFKNKRTYDGYNQATENNSS